MLGSLREFFASRSDGLDAFVYSAESGSAWSLRYPAYTVAVPQPDVLAVPLAYPMARENQELANFINTWIELKQQDGTIAAFYDYRILGKHTVPKRPRWSVLHNVLGTGIQRDPDLGDDLFNPWM